MPTGAGDLDSEGSDRGWSRIGLEHLADRLALGFIPNVASLENDSDRVERFRRQRMRRSRVRY